MLLDWAGWSTGVPSCPAALRGKVMMTRSTDSGGFSRTRTVQRSLAVGERQAPTATSSVVFAAVDPGNSTLRWQLTATVGVLGILRS